MPASRNANENTMPSIGPVKKMNSHSAPDSIAGHG